MSEDGQASDPGNSSEPSDGTIVTDRPGLDETAASLREGRRDPVAYAADCYDRVERVEGAVRAWVDGPKSRPWVRGEAAALLERYPRPDTRPSLFGIPVGVKDIIQVDGLPTKAGSELPADKLTGPQAPVVDALREAGAFVLGKTVTAEFAYAAPGPTRNPNDLDHTPGGSSSGSAAAVAAGMCPLALGTQTVGSVIRPASFCGVVGFKPSYGRIPTAGVIPCSKSVDHVGLFTQDVPGAALAASVVCDDWEETTAPASPPTLGVPEGAYLSQVSDTGREAFEDAVGALRDAGYEVRRETVMDGIDGINERHRTLVAAEAALSHHDWFEQYGDRYADSTAELVRNGREVSVESAVRGRRSRHQLRTALADHMNRTGIDLWISPSAVGPAPAGVDDTGDPTMNLPWTHAGLPTVSLPAGTVDGLPVGLQCAGAFGRDETVLMWADPIAQAVAGAA